MSLPNHYTTVARPSATAARVAPAAHTARVMPKPSLPVAAAAAAVGAATGTTTITTPSYALLHHEGLHDAGLAFLPMTELKAFTPSDDDTARKPATACVIFSTTLGNYPQRAETLAQLLGAVCGAAWSAPTDADGGFVFAPGVKKQHDADAVVRMLHRSVLFDVGGVWYARTEKERAVLEAYVGRSPLTCDVLEVVEASCRWWARAVVETKGDWATRASFKPPTPARGLWLARWAGSLRTHASVMTRSCVMRATSPPACPSSPSSCCGKKRRGARRKWTRTSSPLQPTRRRLGRTCSPGSCRTST